MEKFKVMQWDKGEGADVAFEGTKEECERFVELKWELLSMTGNPIETDFEIEEG
jgi:hypothetical protein